MFVFSIFFYCFTLLTILQDPTIQYPMNIDGYFLEKPINELIQKRESLTVPLLTGVNNHEGGWLLAHVSLNQLIRILHWALYFCPFHNSVCLLIVLWWTKLDRGDRSAAFCWIDVRILSWRKSGTATCHDSVLSWVLIVYYKYVVCL